MTLYSRRCHRHGKPIRSSRAVATESDLKVAVWLYRARSVVRRREDTGTEMPLPLPRLLQAQMLWLLQFRAIFQVLVGERSGDIAYLGLQWT